MDKLIAIKNLFSINLSNIWIALDDIESEGTWKWDYLNTTKIFPNNHNLWAPGEPDNLDKTHDCVEMEEIPYYAGYTLDIYGHIRLHDVSCNRNQTVICESLVARTQLEQNDFRSGSINAFKTGNFIFVMSFTILQVWL